jgi:hypothetical protein
MWGEAFGVFCWLWIFHRARHDGPVVLGFRHPWDHVDDPWKAAGEEVHPDDEKDLEQDWDTFLKKVSLHVYTCYRHLYLYFVHHRELTRDVFLSGH